MKNEDCCATVESRESEGLPGSQGTSDVFMFSDYSKSATAVTITQMVKVT